MELIESNSSWIIALGKTLLNSLWIGLVVFSLLKVLFLLVPHRFSAFRYRASLLSIVLFAGITTALFIHLYTPDELLSVTWPVGKRFPEALSTGNASERLGISLFYPMISLIYFAGMTVYLLITITSLGKIRALKKNAVHVTGRWDQLFNKLKADAGILQKVEFLMSEHVSGPFITGIFKPALIVPAAMLSQLSFRELEAILMHEIHHLKKLDHVFNLLQRIIEILFFFNPAIWMLSQLIRTEREKRCDDLVLAGPTRALDYARALYIISMQDNGMGLKHTAAMGSGKSELRQRIIRILKPNTMKSNQREKITALLLFTCGIMVVLLVSGFTSGFSITPHHDAPPEIIIQAEPDTLTQAEKDLIMEEVREALEEARAKIDWDEVIEDYEELRNAAMEDIDWEQIKIDMEEVRIDIIEEIDWEQIKNDMKELRIEAMEEIDWEQAKMDMEEAKQLAIEGLNWEELKKEMGDIDWEQMKIDMANLRINIDSMLSDFDFDIDMDFDMDHDMDRDTIWSIYSDQDPEL